MIRPFTAVTFALAAGMVLYTYQAKHDVQLLDREIEKTLTETVSLREQSRTLKAEWTLRENPDRLKAFADQYLTLKPLAPTQFTTLAELDSRLPAPIVGAAATDPNATTEEPETPVAEAAPPATVADVAEDLPIPPLPVPPPAMAVATQVPPVPAAAPAPAPAPKPVVQAAPAPIPPKPLPQSPSVLAAVAPLPAPTPQPRPPLQAQAQPVQAQQARSAPVQAPPVQMRAQPVAMPQPQYAPQPAPQPPMGGSLLGMAHGGSFAPSPRPMPVATTQWPNGN
jgi:hypothetical protein